MNAPISEKYDAVIVGAGIGGLVCGCYLARAGQKVLIVEQHSIPGGYCTSFERKGFVFDVGVHYMGSLREDGILTIMLKDLGIYERIKFLTCDPVERIIFPDKTYYLRLKKEDTKKELIEHFPKEKGNINRFFDFLYKNDFLNLVAKTKKITFKELLDSFFFDSRLKSVLSVPLVNIGLAPSQVSALVVVVIMKEYVFDGGYYPVGGVQALPDLLVKRFQEYGGQLRFSTKVEKITLKNNLVSGVELQTGEVVIAKKVVSNADATLTFEKLVGSNTPERKTVKCLRPSPSAFIAYLGINKYIDVKPKHYTTSYFTTYDLESCYDQDNDLLNADCVRYILCTFSSLVDKAVAPPGKSTVNLFIETKYGERIKWKEKRGEIFKSASVLVNKFVPELDFKKDIEVREFADPSTFARYTSNRDGAIFGWAASPEQIDRKLMPAQTSIDNLYLVGHWVTNGIGQSSISLVALCGIQVAKLILNKDLK